MKIFKYSLIAVIALHLIACSDTATNTAGNSNSTGNSSTLNRNQNSSVVAVNNETTKGHDLYVKNCADCHKESGEGGEKVVDGKKIKADNLTDDRRKKLTDEKMIKVMVEGIEDEGMPSYKDKLSEAEMREIVRYIRIDLQKMPADQPYANSANGPK